MKNDTIISDQELDKISEKEIEWLLENDEVNALEFDPRSKKGFITIGGRKIRNRSRANKGILSHLNRRRRRERQAEFDDNVDTGNDIGKIRIVCEGDSWFNYPTRKFPEVIDHIFKDYSIFSLSFGGDWLANIWKQQEYTKAIRKYRPEVFLISGGGNDLVGGSRLEEVLKKYTPDATADQLIKKVVIKSIIKDFEVIYDKIF